MEVSRMAYYRLPSIKFKMFNYRTACNSARCIQVGESFLSVCH
jgi:hypothetical protein